MIAAAGGHEMIGRVKTIGAFNQRGEYSHVLPWRQSGYVDGLFHLSMLAGAARIVKDALVADLAEKWIRTLLAFGPDARNWLGGECTERSPQAFAGPCALAWAIDQGADLNLLDDWSGIRRDAKWFALISSMVFSLRSIGFIGQHVNSCMLACLLTGRKAKAPAALLTRNPFYSFIAGESVKVEDWPIRKPWGSAWVWKQDKPYPSGESEDLFFEYTPVALYVADALLMEGGSRGR